MKKTLLLSLLFILSPIVAHATTCDAGYWLNNGVCALCSSPYYCPGDDTRQQCPPIPFTNDEMNAQYGVNLGNVKISSTATVVGPESINRCTLATGDGLDEYGNMFYQVLYKYDDVFGEYRRADYKRYYRVAGKGYFLTGWYNDWFLGFNPCTNAPTNAHYTGAGTPDSADGTIVDANDCPWVCDAGYYDNNGTCTLCPAGYACANGEMTNCANVTGANGRPTYTESTGGASVCTECPEIQQSLQNRLRFYFYFPYTYDRGINGCIANINDDDPDGTYTINAWHGNDNYGMGTIQTHLPKECIAGKYSTLESAPEWGALGDGAAICYGNIDCMKGRVCTDVGAGYYSPEGDTARYACDTPPANAHITVACTPGANSAWECDIGYGRTANDTCEPLCAAGMTKLNTSNGLSFNIYANKLTTPALNLLRNNTVCYVNLSPGVVSGAINVQHGDAIYHTTN